MSQDNANSPASTAAPDADDLLSKMATDEIDRLLAEAESEPAARPIEAPAPAEAQEQAVAADVAPASVGGETLPSEQVNTEATSLNDLFKKGEQSPSDTELKDATAPGAVSAVTSGAEPATANSVPGAPAIAAAVPAGPGEEPAASAKQIENAIAATEPPPRDPIFIRILETINSPFSHLDDGVRNIIGMIGLLTLFNAIAVLAYVHFVRKH